jgi:DNA-binding LacI/PurR family transcriptional regulator
MRTTESRRRPATSADVARLAGVSRATVSNILNGRGARFPEATRDRVLAAAGELAYRPSSAGRSLVSGHSDTVVVLLPNTTFGSNLQDAVDQVVDGTSQLGGNVVVRFAGRTPQATLAAIAALRPMAVVDLGVLTAPDRAGLEDHGVVVVPSDPSRGPASAPDGGISHLQATALLERGPRTLWFASLADKRLDPFGPDRYAALCAFCTDRGLDEPRRVRVPLELPGATAALEQVMGAGPVGVACYNDDVAIALLAAARRLRVAVPERLAVVGVDHAPLGQLWEPPLTTVDTDLRGVIRALAADLRTRLTGSPADEAPPARVRFALVRGRTT